MKKIGITAVLIILMHNLSAQVRGTDTLTNAPMNSIQNILSGNGAKKVTLGAYAQIDYNQPFNDTTRSNGNLDVHRLVMFMGYQFNEKVQFATEIEFEHISEVFVEQAFLNYKINDKINFRGGLMLIPMGIINEYHEPTTYNGVERPNVDGRIVPTTWRELGAGFTGAFNSISLRYQAYVFNGFLGYGNSGVFRGSDGFRSGRQKGAESTMSSPNFSGKIDYYGINGLKIGAAAYIGTSQSSLYNGLPNDDDFLKRQADSSVVGLGMYGLDVRYNFKGFEARGQFIYADISNTDEYNVFAKKDLGTSMLGYYAEIGYDVLKLIKKNAKERIVVFGRYEFYDTHNSVTSETIKNDAFARTEYTFGLTYHVAPGAAFKIDYQILDNDLKGKDASNQINAGIGIWF